MILSFKINQAGTTQQSGMSGKFMMLGMPIMFFFILYNAPSGLLLYWMVMNFISIGQQMFVNKRRDKEKKKRNLLLRFSRQKLKRGNGGPMVREFEGKTENEAIALAMATLNLEQNELDIEIVDSKKRGLFKKGNVKIRVYLPDEAKESGDIDQLDDFEQQVVTFTTTVFEKMGYPAQVKVAYKRSGKLSLDVVSEYSSIIIGKKGKPRCRSTDSQCFCRSIRPIG